MTVSTAATHYNNNYMKSSPIKLFKMLAIFETNFCTQFGKNKKKLHLRIKNLNKSSVKPQD